VDSHTAGEPTRVILAPVQLPGKTIAQKRDYFRRYYDHLRRLLMAEPRGHRDMFGAVITQPTHPDSDVGVFYMDNGGYLNMCIHGSIGVITTVLQLCTPKTTHSFGRDLTLDTPVGTVHAQAFSAGGRAMKIVVRNVPSFVYAENVIIRLPDLRSVRADIVFAGNFFALVDPKQFHLRITKSQITTFAQLGVAIKAAAREQVEVCHPLLRHISQVDLVEFCEDRPQSNATTTLVVFGRGQIDRSPCGTGTCAYMALAHHRGRLRLGQSHRQCGILGTIFEGSLVQETQVGPYCAVVPQVCGSAYITGFHEFIVECGDPLPNGFLLE
jgi:proline racemase